MNPFASQIATEKYRDLLSNSQNQRMINLLAVDKTDWRVSISNKIGNFLIRIGHQITFSNQSSHEEQKRVHPFRRVL